MRIILGIGSNLGDRLQNIIDSIHKIKSSLLEENVICSSIYETKALLKEDSPKEWDINFYNMVIMGETKLSPQDILKKIKTIESEIGRKAKEIWAPREIDIDILAFGEEVISQEKLTIPHKELLNRKWCIVPFAEIFSDWKYPVEGKYYQKTIAEISELIIFDEEYFHRTRFVL